MMTRQTPDPLPVQKTPKLRTFLRPLPQQFLRHLREAEAAEVEDLWDFFVSSLSIFSTRNGRGLGGVGFSEV